MLYGDSVSTPSPSKLAELCARTDQQLMLVILGELGRALTMAKAAVSKESPCIFGRKRLT